MTFTGLKFCKDCGEEKQIEAFGKDRGRPDGHSFYCRPCSSKRNVAWQRANPEKAARGKAKHKRAYPDREAAYSAAYRRRHPDRKQATQARQDLKRYGLTPETYVQKLADQGGACLLCRTDVPGGPGRFHVDHDHACCGAGRACDKCRRGLLCHHCNLMLGNARESVELLRAAALYLAEWKKLTVFRSGKACL